MKRIAKAAALTAASCALVVGGAGAAMADAGPLNGLATGSPGILSGNVLQLPVNVPLNACGLGLNVLGLLNPATGNTCANV